MLDAISVLIQFITNFFLPTFGLLLVVVLGLITFKNISNS